METRIIVVPLVSNDNGDLLLCRMCDQRGVFPGQWGLPGGGIEPGEQMIEALRRELQEEVGLEVRDIEPALFKDGTYDKTFADGSQRPIYMIFLLFRCLAVDPGVTLGEEHDQYAWVPSKKLADYDLNLETADTLSRLGLG